MDFLSNIVQQVLGVFYGLTKTLGFPNYGVAIILMTIVVKMLLYPLTKKQIESTKAMMSIQPKMKALQEKYKNDKQRLNMELANLYKTEGVNPLAGCLPLLVQMPIMIGIFYGIRDFNYVGSSTFLIWDIAKSFDDINKAAGFAAAMPYLFWPVLSAASSLVVSIMSMPAGGASGAAGMQNKMMTYGMPIFIGYISVGFPTGLVIYWVVMNLVQIVQQKYMMQGTH